MKVNTSKRILLIILLLSLAAGIAAGCSSQTTLATPAPTIEGKVLSWATVEGATDYIVDINNQSYSITIGYFNLDILTVEGEYTIKVKATSSQKGYTDSEFSAPLLYRVGTKAETTSRLMAPSGLYISSGYLNFTRSLNALQYVIYIDGTQTATQSSTRYRMPTLADGVHYVEIVAVNAQDVTFLNSDRSVPLYFEVSNGVILLTPLAAPTDITLTGNVLSWRSVLDATGYRVKIDDKIYDYQQETSFTLELTDKKDYYVSVRSVGDGERFTDSAYSTAVIVPFLLPGVSGVHLQGRKLSWDAVASATTYEINMDGALLDTTTETQYVFDEGLENGDHVVKIKAKGNEIYFYESPYSAELPFTVRYNTIAPTVLDTPTDFKLEGDVLSWGAVYGASGYRVSINGQESEQTALSYKFSSATDKQTAKVAAIGDGIYSEDSVYSREFTYTAGAVLSLPPQNLQVSGVSLVWEKPADMGYNHTYTISINNVETAGLTATAYSLSNFESGSYYIKVKAVTISGTSGDYSAEYHLTVPYVPPVRLSAPSDMEITEGGVLSFSPVSGADNYEIYVNGVMVKKQNTLSVNLLSPQLLQYSGVYFIKVRAITRGEESEYSLFGAEVAYRYVGEDAPIVSEQTEVTDFTQLLTMTEEGRYVLTQDIDLEGAEVLPIGWSLDEELGYYTAKPFKGELNGNGYAIKNFTLKAVDGVAALFAANDGTIKNLSLKNVTLSYTSPQQLQSYSAALFVITNNGLIERCSVQGSITIIDSTASIAGFADVNDGCIVDCSTDVTITIANTQGGNLFSVAGAITRNNNLASIECRTTVNGALFSTDELYLGGVSVYNYGYLNINNEEKDVAISLAANGANVVIGGLLAYNLASMVSAETQLYNGMLLGEESFSQNSFTAKSVTVSVQSVGMLSDIGGLFAENAGSMASIDVDSVSLSSEVLKRGTLSGLAKKNTGDINGVQIGTITINSSAVSDETDGVEVIVGGLIHSNGGRLSDVALGTVTISDTGAQNSIKSAGLFYENSAAVARVSINALTISAIDNRNSVTVDGIAHTLTANGTLNDVTLTSLSVTLSGVVGNAEYNGIAYQNLGAATDVTVNGSLAVTGGLPSALTACGGVAIIRATLSKAHVTLNFTLGAEDEAFAQNRYANYSVCGIGKENKWEIEDSTVTLNLMLNGTLPEADEETERLRLNVYGALTHNAQIAHLSQTEVSLSVSSVDGGVKQLAIYGVAYVNYGTVADTTANVSTRLSPLASLTVAGALYGNEGSYSHSAVSAKLGNVIAEAATLYGLAAYNYGAINGITADFSAAVLAPTNFYGICLENQGEYVKDVLSVLNADFGDEAAAGSNINGAFGTSLDNVQGVVLTGTLLGNAAAEAQHVIAESRINGAMAIGLYTDITAAEGEFAADENALASFKTALSDYYVGSAYLPITAQFSSAFLPKEAQLALNTSTVSVDSATGTVFDLNSLVYTVYEENAAIKALHWLTSAQPLIASVTPHGVLTVFMNGTTTLTGVIMVQDAEGEITERQFPVTLTVTGFIEIDGLGTQAQPFIVTNAENLRYIEYRNEAYFKLANDITLTQFNPLCQEQGFAGVLDGDGHTLTIGFGTQEGAALFNTLNGATVKNLKVNVASCAATTTAKISGIAVTANASVIEACDVTLSIAHITVPSVELGGIVHTAGENTAISRCSFGTVGAIIASSTAKYGGIAVINNGTITTCSAVVYLVTEGQSAEIGGLVTQNNWQINGSMASGLMECASQQLFYGGVVSENNADIAHCYSAIKMEYSAEGGALGGFVNVNNSNISYSYASGYFRRTGGSVLSAVGGFCGGYGAGTVKGGSFLFEECYVDSLSFGYDATVDYNELYGSTPPLDLDVTVHDMSVIDSVLFSPVYWTMPTADVPYPVLKGIGGQTVSSSDMTGTVPQLTVADDGVNLNDYFVLNSDYDVTFCLPVWSVKEGTSVSITPGGILSFDREGVGIVQYEIGGASREFSVTVSFFAEGAGTVLNPYVIYNAVDFFNINRNLSANYKIGDGFEYLDLGGAYSTKQCIGSAEAPFTGSFDGNNVPITNYMQFISNVGGLFAYVDGATFSNVKLGNYTTGDGKALSYMLQAQINDGNMYTGSLVGVAAGNTTISNVDVDVTYNFSTQLILMSTDFTLCSLSGIVGNATGTATLSDCAVTVRTNSSVLQAYCDVLQLNAFGAGNCVVTDSTAAINPSFKTTYKITPESSVFSYADLITPGSSVAGSYGAATQLHDMDSAVVTYDDIVNEQYSIVSDVISVTELSPVTAYPWTVTYTDAAANTTATLTLAFYLVSD